MLVKSDIFCVKVSITLSILTLYFTLCGPVSMFNFDVIGFAPDRSIAYTLTPVTFLNHNLSIL